MKFLTLLSVSVLSLSAFADTSTTTLDKTKSLILEKGLLTVETETAFTRDDNNDVTGYDRYFLIEPGYKFSSKLSASVGAQYNERDMSGDKIRSYGTSSYKDDESKNRDALLETYARVDYKLTSFKENGVLDIRLNSRIYKAEDSFFKEYYGSDGNYQFRAYFGRPLIGNFKINKYVSYLRYKKYITNEDSGSRSRDYELRARITPSYNITKDAEVGMTFTYNHIFQLGAGYADDIEEIDADLTARYQYGKFAVLLRAGVPWLNNSETGDLKVNDDALNQVGYALNFAAYIL